MIFFWNIYSINERWKGGVSFYITTPSLPLVLMYQSRIYGTYDCSGMLPFSDTTYHYAAILNGKMLSSCRCFTLRKNYVLPFHTLLFWTIFNSFMYIYSIYIQEGCSFIFLRITSIFDLVCLSLKANQIRINCRMSMVMVKIISGLISQQFSVRSCSFFPLLENRVYTNRKYICLCMRNEFFCLGF